MTRRVVGGLVLVLSACSPNSSVTAPSTTATIPSNVPPTRSPAAAAITTSTVSAAATSTVSAGATSSIGAATTPSVSGATTSTTAPAATTPPASPPTTTVTSYAAGIADDPGSMATQLAVAEHTIRDPAAPADAVAAAGRHQQLLYRRLGSHPEWQTMVRASLPGDVLAAFDRNLAARMAVSLTKPVPPLATVPAWRIRPPRPIEELLAYYHEAEAKTGVPWYYIAAINLVETRVGRIQGLSTAGAQGPMQFLPSTWTSCCTGNIDDDHDAIVGAATYLKRSGAPAQIDRAILQYNPNQTYLVMVTSYAEVMRDDPLAYRGYHAWEVFYSSSAGSMHLPVGYESPQPQPADAWLAAHPDEKLS